MKRILIFTLLAVMIFACLASCTEKDPSQQPKDTKNPGADTSPATVELTVEATTEAGDYSAELPDEKFPGDFNILCEGSFWATDTQLYLEEASDDPVDNGVWRRVVQISDQFDADIIVWPSADTTADLKKDVKSNARSYGAVCARMPKIAVSAANKELMNLYDVEGLDLKKDYWDQSANEQLSIGGKLFYTVGDIVTVEDMCTWTMMFNKELAKSRDFEDLYKVVKEGRWTFDYFYKLLKDDLSFDYDGNQAWDYLDKYAFSTHRDMAYGFFYGADLSFVTKDENDIPRINDNQQYAEKAQKVLEYALKVMREDNLTLDAHKWTHVTTWSTVLTEACFREDRAYFYAEVLSTIISLRDMDTDFGLLPMPKYDDKQKEYTTFVNPAASLIGVPVYWEGTDSQGNENSRRTGVLLEAMAYYGHEYIVPEFIEKAIKGKGTRDVESIDMLEIILKNRKYDLGWINDWGGIATGYSDLVFNNKNDYASMFGARKTKANNALKKFLSKLDIE